MTEPVGPELIVHKEERECGTCDSRITVQDYYVTFKTARVGGYNLIVDVKRIEGECPAGHITDLTAVTDYQWTRQPPRLWADEFLRQAGMNGMLRRLFLKRVFRGSTPQLRGPQ